jgi:peroxiredoxin
MPFLTNAGVTLRYDRAGRGPVVLLLHGWTANRSYWDRQVQALRDRYTVVTVDLRGHGESSRPRTGYTMGAMAGDLEHLVRALATPRIAVVGWSMGGLVAQELARRLGERLSALVLVCTTPGGLADPKNPQAQPERGAAMKAEMAKDFRAFVRGFAPQLFKAGAASPLLAWAVGQMQKTAPQVALASFEAFLAADARETAASLRVPTAVLHGRHDALLPLAAGEDLARRIPGATLTVFEESGHAPFLEEPEAFNDALTKRLVAS